MAVKDFWLYDYLVIYDSIQYNNAINKIMSIVARQKKAYQLDEGQ